MANYCKCGCNELIKDGNSFKIGHNSKQLYVRRKISETLRKKSKEPGFFSKERNQKISQALMNHIVTEETKRKIGKGNSISLKGNIPWNKGKRGVQIPWNKGKKLSKTHIKKLSDSHKGIPSPKKGKPSGMSKEKHPMWGKHHTEESKLKNSIAHQGDKAANWNGGTSFLPYCPKFNNLLKERVRNRDNRTCQLCGKKENGQRLHVHHIHYDKENCNPDLISLCVSCHTKTIKNRDYYERYFMNILNEKGLLYWK